VLLAEALLRRGKALDALALLTKARDAQRQLYGGDKHLDLWPTLSLRAIAVDALHGPGAARADYDTARDLAHALLPAGHPDRARASWLADQAVWRDTRSPAAREALVRSGQALQAAWQPRADAADLLPRPAALLAKGPAARAEDLWPVFNP
jgi:hypothetical protein